MSSLSLLRLATRSVHNPISPTSCAVRRLSPVMSRSTGVTNPCAAGCPTFSTSGVRRSGAHAEESYDEFNARFEKEFDGVQDVFELQRNLNNAFAYDIVPNTDVVRAALRAARRVHDFPTAVRIFEGLKAKVQNVTEYNEYLEETKEDREEMGVPLKEEMYPDE